MTIFSKNLGGSWPFGPPSGYAYSVNWRVWSGDCNKREKRVWLAEQISG